MTYPLFCYVSSDTQDSNSLPTSPAWEAYAPGPDHLPNTCQSTCSPGRRSFESDCSLVRGHGYDRAPADQSNSILNMCRNKWTETLEYCPDREKVLSLAIDFQSVGGRDRNPTGAPQICKQSNSQAKSLPRLRFGETSFPLAAPILLQALSHRLLVCPYKDSPRLCVTAEHSRKNIAAVPDSKPKVPAEV
jgi:hypothetical protein